MISLRQGNVVMPIDPVVQVQEICSSPPERFHKSFLSSCIMIGHDPVQGIKAISLSGSDGEISAQVR